MDDEKSMEIEALLAIFMDDIKLLGDDRLEIVLSSSDSENKVSVSLDVRLPAGYPQQEVPSLSLRTNKGIAAHKLFDLEKSLREQAKENIGTAMIFTLAQSVKEWLDAHKDSEAAAEMAVAEVDEKEKRKKEQDDHERRIAAAVPITVEVFKKWKAKFDAEMAESRKKIEKDSEKLRRPTGRQLFEFDISLIMSDTNLPEDGDTVDASALVHDIHQAANSGSNSSNVAVNWELFDDVPDDVDDE